MIVNIPEIIFDYKLKSHHYCLEHTAHLDSLKGHVAKYTGEGLCYCTYFGALYSVKMVVVMTMRFTQIKC